MSSGGYFPNGKGPSGITGSLYYRGTWNANTNTPTLASGVGTRGDYYVVSVSGATNIDGITDWVLGDWIVFNGTAWQKADHTDVVTSVAGRTGAVVLTIPDIGEGDGDLKITNAAKGIILKDRATSTYYRFFINNNIVRIEPL